MDCFDIGNSLNCRARLVAMVMIIIAAIISLILNMIYIHVYMLYLIYVGETDLMMGQKTLHRGSRSAFKIFFCLLVSFVSRLFGPCPSKGDATKKNKRRRNKNDKAGKRRRNKKKTKGITGLFFLFFFCFCFFELCHFYSFFFCFSL